MAIVTFRYWAAAKEAAGATEEQVAALTLAEALAQAGVRAPSGPRFRRVLAMSSLLIDGAPVGTRAPDTVRLDNAAVIEVLPPFAGG
jgi:molybdopterin converting factor small subunit